MTRGLRFWLSHAATRRLHLDHPEATRARVEIIRGKPLLEDVYREWYRALAAAVPSHIDGSVLELGSGAGFLRDVIPDVVRSDILPVPTIDVAADGAALPFRSGVFRAVVMTDVLHHVARPRSLFRELARCVRPGGVVAMVEPWLSTWSRTLYGRFHHEPCEPETTSWEFTSTGPLSGANLAQAWVMFNRDLTLFTQEFPEWCLVEIQPKASMRYVLSGGVSLRGFVPGATLPLWRRLDRWLDCWPAAWAMFALIVLKRTRAAS